ncbi:MAG: ATP-binding cassette subfamily F protein uup [Candidatus Marinamargulisbacteria bacterium]
MIVISHDRYFMDRVVDQLLVFNETGTIENFPGNYSDYVDTLKAIRGIAGKAAVPDVPETIEQGATSSASPKKKRITNREREELKTLEKDIDRLETEKQKLDALFASGSGTTEEYQLAGGRLKEITLSLNGKLARWESLAESA